MERYDVMKWEIDKERRGRKESWVKLVWVRNSKQASRSEKKLKVLKNRQKYGGTIESYVVMQWEIDEEKKGRKESYVKQI